MNVYSHKEGWIDVNGYYYSDNHGDWRDTNKRGTCENVADFLYRIHSDDRHGYGGYRCYKRKSNVLSSNELNNNIEAKIAKDRENRKKS